MDVSRGSDVGLRELRDEVERFEGKSEECPKHCSRKQALLRRHARSRRKLEGRKKELVNDSQVGIF